MIYDKPGEVIRRYGKTGWKVIACEADGAPSNILQQFFERDGGHWSRYREDIGGYNAISWETQGNVVHIWNEYTDEKAKFMRETLLTIIGNMRSWLGLPALKINSEGLVVISGRNT